MIYQLSNGKTIDTATALNFEERNFVQKMIIYAHMKMDLETFRSKWRNKENPAWSGPGVLSNPTPVVEIILDLERKLKAKSA